MTDQCLITLRRDRKDKLIAVESSFGRKEEQGAMLWVHL